MPEMQEIKSEIEWADYGAQGDSASTTPQPNQNFQWVSQSFPFFPSGEQAIREWLVFSCKTEKVIRLKSTAGSP